VRLALRAHVDQQAVEKLDPQALQRTCVDHPPVLGGRETVHMRLNPHDYGS
jgi:hypothetical protein